VKEKYPDMILWNPLHFWNSDIEDDAGDYDSASYDSD